MASLAELLTQLQGGQETPRAPWRGPGERPVAGENKPDSMPAWYRSVQPYEANIPAAIEGVMAASPMVSGPAGAVTGGLKSVAGSPLAQKLAGGLGTLLGLTAPSSANKGEKGADGKSMAPSNQAYLDLLAQQAALQKRLDAAKATMDTAQAAMDREARTGKGPNYNRALDDLTRAKADFNGLDTQMKALVPAISSAAKQNDPAYQIELKKQQDAVDEEKRRRTMNTSVKELFSDYAGYAPIVSAGLALGAGKMIKGAYVDKFNTKINDLNKRWETAVGSGNKTLADALQTEFQALAKKGPRGNAAAIGTGVGIGEFGQVLPIAADYAKAVPGSDLYNKTTDSMSDWKEVGGRMLTGALLGGIPAKVGASFAARKTVSPTGYAAETRSMPDPPQPGSSPTPSLPNSPNTPGPQTAGTSPLSGQGPASTAANSNTSFADLLSSGAVTKQDMMNSLGIRPANQGANPPGLPKHLTMDDRLAGSKVRNKKTGQIEADPTKKD